MNRTLKYIYLVFIVVFAFFIFYQIRYGEQPNVLSQAPQDSEFKTLARQREEAEAQFAIIEEMLDQIPIHPELEQMVPVPAGHFLMGNLQGHWTEQPVREIYLDNFLIDQYEVTFAQYYAFVNATGHRKPRLAGYLGVDPTDLPRLMNPFSPVVGVSWEDAAAYCLWKEKRLPTEVEWEKAAKGTRQRKWVWGNEAKPYANVKGEADGVRFSSPVGAMKNDRSPYGAMDMTGNVMEWVADWYQEDYYSIMPERNPLGPGRGTETAHYRIQRVIRGGSWNDSLMRAWTSTRFKMDPMYRDVTIGFRCAKSS